MMEAICREIPKVELHAHLNGSVSGRTLLHLVSNKADELKSRCEDYLSRTSIHDGHCVTLNECFEMFKLVHQIVDGYDSLYEAACDVIEEFRQDGVVYLELRSTPRDDPQRGITQRGYIDTILKAIKDTTSSIEDLRIWKQADRRPIIVRYIAAIDRRNSLEHALQTVNLAVEYKNSTGLIVGVDLSGDPSVSDARTFLPALTLARSSGLCLALHLAESAGLDAETGAMLDIPPDRVGHGTFIGTAQGGSLDNERKVVNGRIPLELCPTSNIKGQIFDDYLAHHFATWHSKHHPVVICTDDKGVFQTSLSKELSIIAKTFSLSKSNIVELVRNSLEYIFETEEVKTALRQYFDLWLVENETVSDQ